MFKILLCNKKGKVSQHFQNKKLQLFLAFLAKKDVNTLVSFSKRFLIGLQPLFIKIHRYIK